MKPLLGFVLVTHDRPEQTLFLCERLSALFGAPPIAIHHDFSKTKLDVSGFPSNVRFVEHWSRTAWGAIGVVDGLLSALRLLCTAQDRWGDPEWVVSLSSTDYPIQTAETITGELRGSSWDAYLDTRQIQYYPGPFLHQKLGEFPFQQPRYHQFAFNRYMAIPLLPKRLARRLDIPVEKYCIRSRSPIERFTPFHDGYDCYAGDAWMTIRRRVAHFFLDQTPSWQRLHEHLSRREVPEESFYHTLLGNSSEFQVCTDNLRYTDWKGCYAHPRTLGREDFPRLLASHHHFARKFPYEPALLQGLDEAVAAKQTSAPVTAGTIGNGG